MKDKDYVLVGIFGQPHGLKGEIKINIKTSSLDSFKILKNYFIEGEKLFFTFKKIKKIGKRIVASIENSQDRDEALSLNGKKIFTLRQNFPKIQDGEYYVVDLVGSCVVDLNKNILGVVEDIKDFGAGNLIEIKNSDKKSFYIPMNKENLISIDKNNKIITVDPIEGLLD
mgnify:CR=1 FL=1